MSDVKTISPKCRREEIHITGNLILNSLERDSARFAAYTNYFDAAYIAAAREGMIIIENLIRPAQLTGERKKVNERLGTYSKQILDNLNALEIPVIVASKLTTPYDSFGFERLHTSLYSSNMEGVNFNLKTTLNIVNANIDELKKVGLKDETIAFFNSMFARLNADIELKASLKSDRANLTEQNIDTINLHWKPIELIMTLGKKVFRNEAARKRDYTFTHVKENVRTEHHKKAETHPSSDETTGSLNLTVTQRANGNPQADAEIRVLNTNLRDLTDSEGNGFVDDIPAGTAGISISKPHFGTIIIKNLQIKPGEELELDVQMDAEGG